MIDFIKKIEQNFDIHIIHSHEPLRGKNTFDLDENENIKSLTLKKVKLTNLDVLLPIANHLTELSVEFCEIETLKTLFFFQNLSKLKLSYNPFQSIEIEHLNSLKNLKCLELNGTNINDTTPLKDLISLERLAISGLDQLLEVKGLENLELLKDLELDHSRIDSIEKIAVNENIRSISLRSGKIPKISGVEKYPNLTELIIASNPITQIEKISHLTQLKTLNISSTWINKIEGLDHLTNLEILDLSNQYLEKIEGLDCLIKLRQLNLSENKLRKVENLNNLINLEYLLLECNDIHEFDTSFLHNLRSSCFISLVGNPIKKLDGSIPDHVKIQFETDHWVPKSL